jgi:pimeloyl-ACP methyl ester carboxylesterase
VQRIRGSFAGTFPMETDVPPYSGPALFMLGRQDSSTGYRDAWRILEHYRRATFVVLDRAGHNAQIEQPALFAALVHEWLDRVEEIGPGCQDSDSA